MRIVFPISIPGILTVVIFTFSLVVNNVNPTVTVESDQVTHVSEGDSVDAHTSFSVPGYLDNPYTAVVDWGDVLLGTSFGVAAYYLVVGLVAVVLGLAVGGVSTVIKTPGGLMLFLAPAPDMTPITDLILTWTHIGQALVGSIGALAFIFAFLCNP